MDEEARAATATAAPEPAIPEPGVPESAAPASTTTHASEPPPLPYSLLDRKKSIAFFWILFVLDCTAQPLGLYYGLWYGTNLSHNLGMCGGIERSNCRDE